MASGTITPAIDLAGYKVKIYRIDAVFNGSNYEFRHGLGNITEAHGFLSSYGGLVEVNLYISSYNPDYLVLTAQHSNLNGSWKNPEAGRTYPVLLIVFYK